MFLLHFVCSYLLFSLNNVWPGDLLPHLPSLSCHFSLPLLESPSSYFANNLYLFLVSEGSTPNYKIYHVYFAFPVCRWAVGGRSFCCTFEGQFCSQIILGAKASTAVVCNRKRRALGLLEGFVGSRKKYFVRNI